MTFYPQPHDALPSSLPQSEDPIAFYPLLDMANCPDNNHPNAAHYNLPIPSNEQEQACRDSWYRQAGVDEDHLSQDMLVFQALDAIEQGGCS